jgi:DNA-binding MarR family transcriptional regulator
MLTLKRLASAVQLRPWPPYFQRTTQILSIHTSIYPLTKNSSYLWVAVPLGEWKSQESNKFHSIRPYERRHPQAALGLQTTDRRNTGNSDFETPPSLMAQIDVFGNVDSAQMTFYIQTIGYSSYPAGRSVSTWIIPGHASCACAALRRASRATTQLYDLVLQPSGLKATQFIALQRIYEAGEIPQWKFAREEAVAVETLSRRFAALRKKGLISVKTGGKHGEQVYFLTEAGKQALEIALPYWQRAQERLNRALPNGYMQQLLQICEDIVRAAHTAGELRVYNSVSAPTTRAQLSTASPSTSG